MPIWKQRLLARYHEEAGEGGSNTDGTGTGAVEKPAGGEGGAGEGGAGGDKGAKPSDAEAKLLKEVMRKKDDLAKANEHLTAAQNRLKEFDGIDPGEVRKLLQDRKDAETKALEAKGEWDRLKERMAQEHQTETKSLKEQIANLQKEISGRDSSINELTIGSAFSQSKFLTEDTVFTPAKARSIYGPHFDHVDGKIVGYDKPRGSANRTALVNAGGDPVPFDDAMRKIVDADPEKDHVLKSKVKVGAGSQSQQRQAERKETPALGSLGKIQAGLSTLKIGQ